ncbi:MAG: hypothetical protein JNM13_03970 [Hyphomicrobiaceae bacterium]|nr:hypothetical protein [Hyphomicrobiaceae bacterium]
MWKIATLVWIVLGTTLAGSALMVVLAMPSLASQGMKLIPIVSLAGFAVAIPLAIWIAKRIEALTAPRA